MKIKVCILMSTYNGEKYIRMQLDSILNQKNIEPVIIVRDDCSTDHTIHILNEYEKLGKIKVIKGQERLGPALSFMSLLYDSPSYDYYGFSDQDDIWKPEKILKAVEKLNDRNMPALYCSNQTIYSNGREIGKRFINLPNFSLVNTICGNSLSGCTMIFNRELRDILIREESRPSIEVLRIRMHDVWIVLAALITGQVIYDDNSYIDYRIHNENTVGLNRGIKHKINKLIKVLMEEGARNGRSKTAQELLRCIEVSKECDLKILNGFAYYKTNRKKKINLLKDEKIKKECDENRLFFLFKVLINWI